MTDEKYQGTGDKIGEIDGVEVLDDGHTDGDVHFKFPDGRKSRSFSTLRKHLGDERLEEILSGGMSEEKTVGSSDFEAREPPAFVCQRCHNTWPRTKNDGSGICPDCR